MATSNVGDDYGARVGQVCDEHYARLRHYFLTQLGSAPEADYCVRETIYRFFVFARGRRWEELAEHVPGCVMRTAALLCSEKLEERRRLADARRDDDSENALRGMAEEAARAVQERLRFRQHPPRRPE
ncbi:MAG TPA: hypothetical protein VF591_04990 [Pyrinomonadaceae bacterium]|jgi:hypothetical protein